MNELTLTRQTNKNKYSPKERDGTVSDEDSLPRPDLSVSRHGHIRRWWGDEAGMADLREAVGEETTDNLLRSVHHVPVVDDRCLLLTLVPDRTHDQESRLAYGLEDTEKGPDCDKSREAEAGGV